MISILKEENRTVLRNSLLRADIRYFLIPKQNNPYHDLYMRFLNATLLFKVINDDPHFKIVKELDYYKLFKLMSDDEI